MMIIIPTPVFIVMIVACVGVVAIAALVGYLKGLSYTEGSFRGTYMKGWRSGFREGIGLAARRIDALTRELMEESDKAKSDGDD